MLAPEAANMDHAPLPATKLLYFDHMWTLESTATVVSVITFILCCVFSVGIIVCNLVFSREYDVHSHSEADGMLFSFRCDLTPYGNIVGVVTKRWPIEEGERVAVVLDQTILHPQGGGQPFDTGHIEASDGATKFSVNDVRAKSGVVYHYGNYETKAASFRPGDGVNIAVDGTRRTLNSRLHSAGHLLDACIRNVGLETLEPGKGHHFPDSPFVEYKGAIPSKDLEYKRVALESEVNRLVTLGGQVRAMIAPYSEAAALCGGSLPDYVAKDSCPRIVCLGDNPGCPCGGTHVSDISEIGEVKVTQIRVKKGVSKVCYNLVKSV